MRISEGPSSNTKTGVTAQGGLTSGLEEPSADVIADLFEKSKWEIKETPQELPRGVAQKSSLAEATSSASEGIVTDLLEDSKGVNDKPKAASPPGSTFKERKSGVPTASEHSIADLVENSKGGYKEISDGLSVIAKGSGLGNITVSSLNENVAEFQKDVKAFREKNRIQYQGRV